MTNALMPFVGQVIDPSAFAQYLLKQFGITDPGRLMMSPPPPMPEGGPEGGPPMGPPDDGHGHDPSLDGTEGPVDPEMGGAPPGVPDVPPELLAAMVGGGGPAGPAGPPVAPPGVDQPLPPELMALLGLPPTPEGI